MKAILVTGGAGYAGITLTESLARRYPEYTIVVFDRNQRGCNELVSSLKKTLSNIRLILPEKADVRDVKNVEDALLQYEPEIVVNLAAKVTDFYKDQPGKNEECMATNFEATANIARLCKSKGVKTFIHQSSVLVYEPGENITEDVPPRPSLTYGKSKLMGEQEALALSDDNFKVVVFRASTIVGYNINFKYETMVNLMCVRSVFKVPFTLFESALEHDKTYLDVHDNANAIIFAIENIKELKGSVFNLASFNARLSDVLEIIKGEIKEDFPYTILKEDKKNKQVYSINFDKLKSVGFKPKGSIEEVIKTTIRHLKMTRDFYQDAILKNSYVNPV